MSDILARLRVRETHGIRRFLYPLSVQIPLPEGTDVETLTLTTATGQPVPTQGTAYGNGHYRIDFALSLSPFEEQELLLTVGATISVPDAIAFNSAEEDTGFGFCSKQQRFSVGLNKDADITDVVYDGVSHLRGSSSLQKNGLTLTANGKGASRMGSDLITAWHETGNGDGLTRTELTACKSWATMTHKLQKPLPGDEIIFTLPLATVSPILLCDFGVGGGIYGKLQPDAAPEVVWRSEFTEDGLVHWTVATNDREDYVGNVASAEDYHAQQWFHVLDSDKALAVAMTQIPQSCRTMIVTLNSQGDVKIAFTLGENVNGPVEFGVCYHFLNDAPAIAAATNPQSILLPPTVEFSTH